MCTTDEAVRQIRTPMDIPSLVPCLALQRPHRILPRLPHRPPRRAYPLPQPHPSNPLAKNHLPHLLARKETLRLSRRPERAIDGRSDHLGAAALARQSVVDHAEDSVSSDEAALFEAIGRLSETGTVCRGIGGGGGSESGRRRGEGRRCGIFRWRGGYVQGGGGAVYAATSRRDDEDGGEADRGIVRPSRSNGESDNHHPVVVVVAGIERGEAEDRLSHANDVQRSDHFANGRTSTPTRIENRTKMVDFERFAVSSPSRSARYDRARLARTDLALGIARQDSPPPIRMGPLLLSLSYSFSPSLRNPFESTHFFRSVARPHQVDLVAIFRCSVGVLDFRTERREVRQRDGDVDGMGAMGGGSDSEERKREGRSKVRFCIGFVVVAQMNPVSYEIRRATRGGKKKAGKKK